MNEPPPQFKRTPCGFCFIEYYTREDCEAAMAYINGTRLDDRIIRSDYDAGFTEGRQYGRGKSGGQVGSYSRFTPLLRILGRRNNREAYLYKIMVGYY